MIDALGAVSLFGFVFAATASPGGATALVAASGACFGYAKSLPVMAGICLGMGSLTFTMAIGLGGVLESSATFKIAMQLGGSLYLLWLAISISRQGKPRSGSQFDKPFRVLSGCALIWINPKVWTLGGAAASAYSGAFPHPWQNAMLLGGSFVVVGAVSASLWCLLGAQLALRLATDRQWRLVNIGFGATIVASIVPIWL